MARGKQAIGRCAEASWSDMIDSDFFLERRAICEAKPGSAVGNLLQQDDVTTELVRDYLRHSREMSERCIETLANVMIDTNGKVVVTDAERLKSANAEIDRLRAQIGKEEVAIGKVSELGGKYIYKMEDNINSLAGSGPKAKVVYDNRLHILSRRNYALDIQDVLELPAAVEYKKVYDEVKTVSAKQIKIIRAEIATYTKVLETVA